MVIVSPQNLIFLVAYGVDDPVLDYCHRREIVLFS